jgi:hypothetical protein
MRGENMDGNGGASPCRLKQAPKATGKGKKTELGLQMKQHHSTSVMVVPIPRILLGVAVAVASLCGFGADFLQIWPDARATALGGAMVGLADEANGVYWNPGGLGFQKGLSAAFTGANWLPGLRPGMLVADGDVNYGFANPSDRGVSVTAGFGWTHLGLGHFEWKTVEGDTTITFSASDEAIHIHAGVADEHIGLGLTLKYVVDDYVPEFFPFPIGTDPSSFIGNALALDLGGMYKPVSGWSLGASVANIGTSVIYRDGEATELPLTVRLGLAGKLVDARTHSLLLLAAIENDPHFSYYHGEGTGLGSEVVYRFNRAWKNLGLEGTLKRVFSRFSLTGRVGYFEDPTGARGGFVFVDSAGNRTRVGIVKLCGKAHPSRLQSVGICYGIGVGYKDYIRFDASDDHLIYDFPTSNFKFTLVTHDIIGLVRDLRGHQVHRDSR